MTRQYETVFIMTPVLSEKQIGETVKQYTTMLKSGGAEIVHEGSWGLKKLAYPVQKKSTGFYHCVEFTGGGDTIPAMEVAFKRDERILRFLTVSLDKHAVAFNEKDRKKAKERANAPKEEVAEKKDDASASAPSEVPVQEKVPAGEKKSVTEKETVTKGQETIAAETQAKEKEANGETPVEEVNSEATANDSGEVAVSDETSPEVKEEEVKAEEVKAEEVKEEEVKEEEVKAEEAKEEEVKEEEVKEEEVKEEEVKEEEVKAEEAKEEEVKAEEVKEEEVKAEEVKEEEVKAEEEVKEAKEPKTEEV